MVGRVIFITQANIELALFKEAKICKSLLEIATSMLSQYQEDAIARQCCTQTETSLKQGRTLSTEI